MKQIDDTIAAIATPIGEGGISVIRLSGKTAFEIADHLFRGKTRLKSVHTQTAHVGKIIDGNGEPIDEVVVTVFKSPNSYTAEDCVEISCHGGILVTRKILETLLNSGARLAEPGEFTKRAFLNGRIDLAQAEAVADLIRSQSDLSHKSSVHQLNGALSNKINNLRSQLIDISGLIELELDFTEEDIELTTKSEVIDKIEKMLVDLRVLTNSYSQGRIWREGVKVVISGKPNVGKSSLLNALLDENRAIVTAVPGTTRDVIEENITIDGVLFKLVDTAGLRKTLDPVEKEGVRRTEAEIASSDLILLVFDLSQPPDYEDEVAVNAVLNNNPANGPPLVVVLNKLDISRNGESKAFSGLNLSPRSTLVRVSALTHEGLDALKRAMVEGILSDGGYVAESTVTITNIRHREALNNSVRHLRLALESLRAGKSGDFIALDLRGALNYLGEIVGAVTTDEILENIFSKFCIGK